MAELEHCIKENEKEEEIVKERVSDSPLITESNHGELDSFSTHHEVGPNLETLVVVLPSSSSSVLLDRSDDLQGRVKIDNAGEAENKQPVGPTDEQIIVEEVEAPQVSTENQPRVVVCSSPLSELSPTSIAQSLSSAASPTLPEQRLLPPKVNSAHMTQVERKTPKGGKTSPSVSAARTSAPDGYNWRKYGQKQVKSPTGSRSYYRCTHSDCSAKKIEFCDHSGQVISVVYKSQHSHDPPQKTNFGRESKFLPSSEAFVENSVPEQPIVVVNDSGPSSSSREPKQEVPCSAGADKKQQNSSNSENGKVILKGEDANEFELKRRMKIDDLTSLETPVKPGKKPKLVVHTAADVGISGDGYRWRKYGQKMVKGNPHPRNYYRCTSAGCPVRKHIETARDNSNAAIITYKGVHDHDMPVPKKRHGPPCAPLVAAAAPASMNNLKSTKTDSLQNQKTSTRWSVDTEGELTGEALDLGGEKAIESARTLLSIGFEIKPC
ncbi:PREDICTED: probable WRKY transcription factor 32 isoform X1 [Lupinus angustifolius]|uniref:probable WRKY transcription factor 32 isoform X1 n=1 Tax=Lupinus angustifolius TaxID=3871 RepID=UPI00092F0857|nr:PREDICTED: probable WRKY transcription factor 32 isoform X1 [Lupinus angustifolius]